VDGLKPRRTFFAAALDPRLIEKFLERAEETAFASGLADGFRQKAVAVLLVLGDGQIEQKLLGLLEKNEAPEVQLAVLRNLGESHLAAVQTLVERWSSIPLELREPVWSWLLGRPQRAGRLLEALQQGSLPSETLSSSQRRALLRHSNDAIRTAARELLGESPPAPRQEVLQNYLPSLLLTGERKRGEAIYQERCASCHRYAGAGERIGPDLETASGGGKEKLLLSIIDPHREVAPEFVVYEAATRDGELHSGLLASDSETHLVLKSAQGNETVLSKAEVLTVRQTARSLMPEGLEEGLSLEEMAALLDFLTQ
jgi:putative heme-binding domain-containing protein